MKFNILFILFAICFGFASFFACDDQEKQVLLPILISATTEECKATKINNGYILKCGDSEPITITNGENGKDGQDGDDSSIEIIHLCGNTDGEILIRLPDSTLVAYHQGCLGINEYLTVLTPGDYTSSDKYKCQFNVDENNNITYK